MQPILRAREEIMMTCYMEVEIAKPNKPNLGGLKSRWVSLLFWGVQVLSEFENHRRDEVCNQGTLNPTYGIF